MKFTTQNKLIIGGSLSAVLLAILVPSILGIGVPGHSWQQKALACWRCWHVSVGQVYPAQFNDNDLGQVVKMSCTVTANDQKGHIATSCTEQ